MGTTAGTPRRAPTVGTAADARLWRLAGLAAVAIWFAYVLLPTQFVVLRELVLYPLGGIAAVIGVVVGVRRYRPRAPVAWLLIAAGLACTTVADVIYGWHQVTDTSPFPSIADLFYLAAYPLYAAGLHVAGKVRMPERDRGAFIDAAIITVTAGMFASLLIAQQYFGDPDLEPFEAGVASAYPLADVLLVSVAVRFLLSARWRSPSLQLVALGLFLTLAGDLLYTVQELFTSEGDSGLVDAILLAGTLAMGLAGLHPSMTELTAEAEEVTTPEYSVTRVVTLYSVSLIPVVVLSVQAATANARHVWITITALVMVCVLVVMRFVDLAGQTRRAFARQATLSRLSADLLLRSGRSELVSAADHAAAELVPGGRAHVAEQLPPTDDERTLFVAPVEIDGALAGAVVAEGSVAQLQTTRDALSSVARGLSLALEREALLTSRQEAAERLAEQNEQLRELDHMKDQLVSSVSHELRTPLTSMVGFVELLLGGEVGELNEEQLHFVQVMDRNCRRLNRLIDDILFVARVDAGRLSLEPSWVDVAAVAAASLETAGVRADQGQVRRTLTADDDLPQVWADPTRLDPAVRQPDLERGQVHPARRGDPGDPEPGRWLRAGRGGRHGDGHPPGRGRPALRAVLPRVDGRGGRRHRARAVHRQVDRRGPRWDDRCDQ